MSRRGFLVVVMFSISLLAGCTAVLGDDPNPPTITIENQDSETYTVTAYVFAERNDMAFRVDTKSGDRRIVSTYEAGFGGPYQNVTPVLEERSQQITAFPSTTTSATIDIWNDSVAMVYVIETSDGNATVGDAVICHRGGQDHRLTIVDGFPESQVYTCG